MVTSAMTFHGHFSSPYDFSVLRLVSVHPFTHPLPATRPKTPPNTPLLPTVQLTPFHYYHPNYLSELFLFSRKQMSPHRHLSPTMTHLLRPPPTTSHLTSTAITPITVSELFLFSRKQMSTRRYLSTTMTHLLRPLHLPHPTSLPLPSPQLHYLIYCYSPANT